MTYASGYEVILCGSGLQHLIVSALLASRRVNLLVLSTLNGKKFERDGYQFPTGNPLFIDFGPDSIFSEILAEINLPQSHLKGEGQLFKDLSPFLQTILPDCRIDIFQDEEELLDELCREFSGERDLIVSLFKEINSINSLIDDREESSILYRLRGLIKRGILSGKKAMYLLKNYSPSIRLLRFFDMLSMTFYGAGIEEIGALRFLLLLRMLKGGGRSVSGGAEVLYDLLIRRIKSEGGEFYEGGIEGFVTKKRRIVGIKTDRGDVFECKMAVLEQQTIKRFSFYFGVDNDLIPHPMGDYLLLAKKYSRRGVVEDQVFLSLSPLSDPRWAPKDKRLITATTFITANQDISRPYIEGLKDSIMEQLTRLMPFSGGRIQFLGDDLLLEKINEKKVDLAASLSTIPRNLYLMHDGKDAWIRTSEDLNASYRIARLISDRV